MAFGKAEYKNDSDVDVTYWKVIDYHVNVLYKTVDIVFGGWMSQISRDANKAIVQQKNVRCMSDKFDDYFSTTVLNVVDINAVNQIYRFTKGNSDFFTDASDC